jgi:hypothetical protein
MLVVNLQVESRCMRAPNPSSHSDELNVLKQAFATVGIITDGVTPLSSLIGDPSNVSAGFSATTLCSFLEM